MSVTINPQDVRGVKTLLNKINASDVNKALVRSINTTLTGVRTDGVKMLSDHYALTASAIRESWKIQKAAFNNPSGVVSTAGTFVRLIKFGARQTKTGVSIKVLKKNPRAVIKHAFISKIRAGQHEQQGYWRQYKGARKKVVPGRAYAQMPYAYRFPTKALYGPRLQDYLGDPGIIGTLTKMAGERLTKDMARQVDAILRGY